MIRIIVAALVLVCPPISAGQEARIGNLAITLPEGFVHKPAKGADTLPGYIIDSTSQLRIHYDIGPHSAAHGILKSWKEMNLRLKTIKLQPELGKGFLRAIVIEGEPRWATFATESGIYFSAKTKTHRALTEFTAIVSSIRLVESPDKPEAEQGGGAKREKRR